MIVEWLGERGFELKEKSESNYQSSSWGDSVFVRINKELPPFVDQNVGTSLYGQNYLEG